MQPLLKFEEEEEIFCVQHRLTTNTLQKGTLVDVCAHVLLW